MKYENQILIWKVILFSCTLSRLLFCVKIALLVSITNKKKLGYSGGGDDGLMWSCDDLDTSRFFFHNSIQASMSKDGFGFSGGGNDGLSCNGNGLSCGNNDLGPSKFFFSFNCYDYC